MTDSKKELKPEELKKAQGGAGFNVKPSDRQRPRKDESADLDLSADVLKRVRGGTGSTQHELDTNKRADVSGARKRDAKSPPSGTR